jgi:lycopene beta-cyclase
VDQLIAGKSLANLRFSPRRFKFYDDTLLYILYHHKVAGEKIFTRLFQKNDIHRLLRFLDNESSLADDLGIISTLPTLPFLKAALHQL